MVTDIAIAKECSEGWHMRLGYLAGSITRSHIDQVREKLEIKRSLQPGKSTSRTLYRAGTHLGPPEILAPSGASVFVSMGGEAVGIVGR